MSPPTASSIFTRDTKHSLFTIAPSRPFLNDLAAVLLAEFADAPIDLADMLVLVPTRRTARHLQSAFVNSGISQKPFFLPRIQTIGDLDDSSSSFIPEVAEIERTLAPAISPLLRRLKLAQLVYAYLRNESKTTQVEANWIKSLDLADALEKLLDSFYAEQISPNALKNIVEGPRAQHWERSAIFLDIIITQWPLMLTEMGLLDPADKQRQLIDELARKWDTTQGGKLPTHPVIIAGSTGSMPAVARLMRIISEAPLGATVLPGLDLNLDKAAWKAIDDPHPQSGLKHLLSTYFDDQHRRTITPWPVINQGQIVPPKTLTGPRPGREHLIGLALRPAEATGDWLQPLSEFTEQSYAHTALSGFYFSEAENENDEADQIALLMREVLEEPVKTCLLVTPDRELGRRVSLKLRRWGIHLDDSAGVPFADSLRGNFLRLCAAWLADVSAPVGLMSLLNHPLSTAGFERDQFTRMREGLDLALRGVMPGKGFTGLRRALLYADDWDKIDLDQKTAPLGPDDEAEIRNACHRSEKTRYFAPLIDRLERLATPFLTAGPKFTLQLYTHIEAAQSLAATPEDETGTKALWSYADGDIAAHLINDIHAHAPLIEKIDKTPYPDLFTLLIQGHAVRDQQTHPRLAVLGPLEARLISADRLILGGLNDGVWPLEPGHNPFISRPMRTQIGLPSVERRIGLAAHDFAQLACQKEVILTRAKQAARTPTTPSRWVTRLKNILTVTNQLTQADISKKLAVWVAQLDDYTYKGPVCAPRPTPPVSARPRSLSVTSFEKLMRDPYSIYARQILRLKPLEQIGADLTAAQRGRLIHGVFAAFSQHYGAALPENIPDILRQISKELMHRLDVSPAERGYLAPLLEQSYIWFDTFSRAIAVHQIPVLIEKSGTWRINAVKTPITLTARVDRIDEYINNTEELNSLFIYDYKTGDLPSLAEQKQFSPQLTLTALIAENGGFESLGARSVTQISYLRAMNRARATRKQEMQSGDKLRIQLEHTYKNLITLLDKIYDPSTPYLSQPRPKFTASYGEYDHLARRGEWAVMENDNPAQNQGGDT